MASRAMTFVFADGEEWLINLNQVTHVKLRGDEIKFHLNDATGNSRVGAKTFFFSIRFEHRKDAEKRFREIEKAFGVIPKDDGQGQGKKEDREAKKEDGTREKDDAESKKDELK